MCPGSLTLPSLSRKCHFFSFFLLFPIQKVQRNKVCSPHQLAFGYNTNLLHSLSIFIRAALHQLILTMRAQLESVNSPVTIIEIYPPGS